MKDDQKRVKNLIIDTISMLCRNGLKCKKSMSIQGLIGVTLDDDDVFIIHVNDLMYINDDDDVVHRKKKKNETALGTDEDPPPPTKSKSTKILVVTSVADDDDDEVLIENKNKESSITRSISGSGYNDDKRVNDAVYDITDEVKISSNNVDNNGDNEDGKGDEVIAMNQSSKERNSDENSADNPRPIINSIIHRKTTTTSEQIEITNSNTSLLGKRKSYVDGRDSNTTIIIKNEKYDDFDDQNHCNVINSFSNMRNNDDNNNDDGGGNDIHNREFIDFNVNNNNNRHFEDFIDRKSLMISSNLSEDLNIFNNNNNNNRAKYLSDHENEDLNNESSRNYELLINQSSSNGMLSSSTSSFLSSLHRRYNSSSSNTNNNTNFSNHRHSNHHHSNHHHYRYPVINRYGNNSQTTPSTISNLHSRFACDFKDCGMTFSTKQNLLRHQTNKHGRPKVARRSNKSVNDL